MKIGQPSDNPVSLNTAAQTAPPKGSQNAGVSAAATAAKSTQSAGVAVTVSTLARTMEATNRGQAADVDMEKVMAVRAAMQNGTYKVNAEAIADKLLGNAQEMLNRSSN